MKRLFLACVCAFVAAVAAQAQTMKIHMSNLTVAVPAAEAGEMTFADGQTLSIAGVDYAIEDIDSITISPETLTPRSVELVWSENDVFVTVTADIVEKLEGEIEDSHVSFIADSLYQEEITYILSGTSTDGSFTMDGEFKSTVILNNLTLTNPNGPAIDIENGKRIAVNIPTGTTTTLSDGAGLLHKACFFINGHAEFSGGGTLNLVGNSRHAYASDEYTTLEADFGAINVTSAVSDGLHIEQYFKMKGGTVNISGTAGDGIDVSITKDPADTNNGQAFISGGSLTINVAAEDVKGLKCDSMMTISGGTIQMTVSGNGSKGISTGTDLVISQPGETPTSVNMTVTGTTYMPGDVALESKCRGIKVKGNFTFDGGNISIAATGAKSKAISVDGDYTYVSGSINCAVDAANTI
ncbi:MAG: carbohydrate-binding domain-containing protein [Alloprevotella sp.]